MAKKLIETPEIMWKLFSEYRIEVKDNPIQLVEQVKGKIFIPKDFEGSIEEATLVHLPLQRCLTLDGFNNWLFENDNERIMGADQYFENQDKGYDDFLGICSRILKIIRQDQIEGGMAGIYNASITQRLNNLKETTVLEAAEQPLFPKVPKEIDEVKRPETRTIEEARKEIELVKTAKLTPGN